MSIWIEIRVSQGHHFDREEEAEVTAVIENALDVPARRVFCERSNNLLHCYVRLDADRIPFGRFEVIRRELSRASRDWVSRAVDEFNVVSEDVVGVYIPEAVRGAVEFYG